MQMRQDNYFRVSSAHLQNYDQVVAVNRETPTIDEHEQEVHSPSRASPSKTPKLPLISPPLERHSRQTKTSSPVSILKHTTKSKTPMPKQDKKLRWYTNDCQNCLTLICVTCRIIFHIWTCKYNCAIVCIC